MKKILFLASIFALFSALTLKAQVTVGTLEQPASGAALQVKTINGVLDDAVNAYKGLELPRVSLSDTVNLFPMFLTDPTNPASGPNANYTANKATLDKTHTGLMVYNINAVDPFVKGIYLWIGFKWVNVGTGLEPWVVSGTAGNTKASLNTQNIYQMGAVAVGIDTILTNTAKVPLTKLNVDASDKGVMIPRMDSVQRNKIQVDSLANSLLIYNTSEDCYNYYSKIERMWQSLCGGQGKAEFTISCNPDSLQVMGVYGAGVALNTSNYVKIYVNVTKIGSYSISAVAAQDNGYFFETSGTFYAKGIYSITIPGTGQPIHDTQNVVADPNDDSPDHFTLNSSGGGSCAFDVNVNNTTVQPVFDISCNSVQVQGAYFEDSVLSSKPNTLYDGYPNQISVQLTNIPTSSFGAIATLQTNEVDGISFSWTGTLQSSPQTVIMQGKGIPRGLNDKVMTITSNSTSNTGSCTATVTMLIPSKRLMAVSETAISALDPTYGYNPCRVTASSGSFNDMLTDKNNFGYNPWSIVKFAGFENYAGANGNSSKNFVNNPDTWTDDKRPMIGLDIDLGWRAMSAATLHNYLFGIGHKKVDIFMIAFTGLPGSAGEWFRNGDANDQARCQELVNFVKSGGIMMVCSELPVSNQNFLRLFFNTPTITSAGGHAAGTDYSLGFNPVNEPQSYRPYYCSDTDPIMTGPFNNILGRMWCEDASVTTYFLNIPLDSVVIYSCAESPDDPMGGATYPAAGLTIFRHKDYPFVFVGDAGFNSHNYYNTTGQNAGGGTACPFFLQSINKNGHTYPFYPSYKLNFGPAPGARSDNASFTANAFAWCIYKAEEYRRAHK